MDARKTNFWIFIFGVIILLFLVVIPFLTIKFYGLPENAGIFGDMFGSVNALFSGFAFLGVIYAIVLQRDELRLQREELEQTRKELEGQKIQLQEQNKRSREQTAASILFELTKIYSEDKISEAVYYLRGVWSNHDQEFRENRYTFARKYLNTIEIGSSEWQMRQKVSSFYTDMAAIVEAGLIDEDVIFSSYGPDDIAIIEPIETIIKEKHYSLFPKKEHIALRFLFRCKDWDNRKKERITSRFSLPQDPDLYEKSKKD